MQLSAEAVRWDVVARLAAEGTLEDVLLGESEEVDLSIGETPWPSDSCVEYAEVAELVAKIREAVPEPTREALDRIGAELINDDYAFPSDLVGSFDPELVAGALSPETIDRLLDSFEALDYDEIDTACEAALGPEDKAALQILDDGTRCDAVSEYLRQWEEMLRYAQSGEAGVLLHMG